MRRKAGLLMDALESLEQLFRGYMEKFSPALDKAVSPIQYQICMLGQTVTNAKQFDQFIWPHLGCVMNELAERNLKLYFMVEGNAGALLEHLEDLKSGMCALHVESDPLDELKKRFGDKFTYVGGMPVDVLGSESTENCVKYVKKILDQYAHEGNFVFTTNKGIVYERDASVENLKALCDTVNNFKI